MIVRYRVAFKWQAALISDTRLKDEFRELTLFPSWCIYLDAQFDFTVCFAWEQRKALHLAECSKGKGYSKDDLVEKGTPIILYGRLYTNYQAIIDEVDTFAKPKNDAIYSQGNEVIVPASGETVEDIARASVVLLSGVLLGGDLNILRPNRHISPLFLALTLSNGVAQRELAKRAQGKSVVHIHNSDIQDVIISFPAMKEQTQIGAFFQQLDHLITLHQRKHNERPKQYITFFRRITFSISHHNLIEMRSFSVLR